MKYIITRSSSMGDEEPIKGCKIEEIHNYVRFYKDIKNKPQLWEYANNRCRDLVEEGDCYRGVEKIPEQVFVIDVDDLHDFARQHDGKIILFEPDNEEGLWKIEIYDEHRE